jgi:hypothetical protein
MHKDACIGEENKMTQCKEGYTGFLCAECMPGYRARPLEFICEPCTMRDGNMALSFIQFAVIFAFIAKFSDNYRKRIKRNNLVHRLAIIKLFFLMNQLLYIL